jgi:hypothetical protein
MTLILIHRFQNAHKKGKIENSSNGNYICEIHILSMSNWAGCTKQVINQNQLIYKNNKTAHKLNTQTEVLFNKAFLYVLYTLLNTQRAKICFQIQRGNFIILLYLADFTQFVGVSYLDHYSVFQTNRIWNICEIYDFHELFKIPHTGDKASLDQCG